MISRKPTLIAWRMGEGGKENIGCNTKQHLKPFLVYNISTYLPNGCDDYKITCDPARDQRLCPVEWRKVGGRGGRVTRPAVCVPM